MPTAESPTKSGDGTQLRTANSSMRSLYSHRGGRPEVVEATCIPNTSSSSFRERYQRIVDGDCLVGVRVWRSSGVAREVVWINLEDDAPEEVEYTEEYHDGKDLAYPFWQVLLGVVALSACLGGLIWVNVGSEGAVVWRRSYEER